MKLRSATPLLAVFAAVSAPASAQSRIIDEGTFVVLRAGAPARTESFKISRGVEGQIIATGLVSSGTQQITSSLTTDSIGTPVEYELRVRDKGAKVVDLRARSTAGRLTSMSSTQAGDESMREYPLTVGKSVIVESGLFHHLYFAAHAKKPGGCQIIEPRGAKNVSGTLAARGLEPIEIAGRSVTATHYVLSHPSARYDFWLDAQGRLLRVEADGLTATREELPR